MRQMILSTLVVLLLGAFHSPLQASEVDELRAKAVAMKQKAAELAKAGQVKEAEVLIRGVRELMEKVAVLEAEGAKKKGRPANPDDIERLKKHLHDLAEKERFMVKSKASEKDLDTIRTMIAGVEKELAALTKAKGPGKRPHQPEIEEAMRKLEHMRVAAENLKAAGLPEAAEQLMEQARKMEREIREARERAEAGKRGMKTPGKGPHGELEGQVRELREQVERLRAEIQELRNLLKKR